MFVRQGTEFGQPIIFFRTAPMPCPYLDNRLERRLIADLSKQGTRQHYDALTLAGFRRSQGMIYRPACNGCQSCIPVRIPVEDFRPSKSQNRIKKANQRMFSERVRPIASWEQFRLFTRYQKNRHAGSEMSYMTFEDYRDMIEISPIDSWLIEYRDETHQLIGTMLVDAQHDGLSAVYSFFEPMLEKRGLGTFMILDLIDKTRAQALPYLYLGYWVDGSRKMAYKSRFRPLQGLIGGVWQPLDILTAPST